MTMLKKKIEEFRRFEQQYEDKAAEVEAELVKIPQMMLKRSINVNWPADRFIFLNFSVVPDGPPLIIQYHLDDTTEMQNLICMIDAYFLDQEEKADKWAQFDGMLRYDQFEIDTALLYRPLEDVEAEFVEFLDVVLNYNYDSEKFKKSGLAKLNYLERKALGLL